MTTSVELPGQIGSESHSNSSPPAAPATAHSGNGNGSPAPVAPTQPWSLNDSAKLYSIQQWGNGYFSINDDGHVAVHPTQRPEVSVDLKKLVDELRERDIALPILIRF